MYNGWSETLHDNWSLAYGTYCTNNIFNSNNAIYIIKLKVFVEFNEVFYILRYFEPKLGIIND